MSTGNVPPPLNLDRLVTPEEIAKRITASSGVQLTARTVWEKANRIGIAKKIGRSMFISIDDIPALLQQEDKRAQLVAKANAGRALEELRRNAKRRRKLGWRR